MIPVLQDLAKHRGAGIQAIFLYPLNALMSGSGPAVFGLYDDLQAAKETADCLQKRFPDVFFAAVPFCYNHKELD